MKKGRHYYDQHQTTHQYEHYPLEQVQIKQAEGRPRPRIGPRSAEVAEIET